MRPLWEPRHKLNYNIKMYLKKTEWRIVDWVDVANYWM